MPELQQSPHWDTYCGATGFIEQGFPFNERFPEYSETDIFEIIVRDGTKHRARVDFSTQYRAEGLQWRSLFGDIFSRQIVVAWKELRE